jgi:replicative DNA helicase
MTKQYRIELQVIGVILNHPETIVSYQIEPRWFDTLRKPIEVMLSMAGSNITIDAFGVHERLHGYELWVVCEWQTKCLSCKANFQYSLDLLRDIFIAKGIKRTLESALREIEQGTESIEAVSEMLTNINKLQSMDARNHNYTMKEALKSYVDHLDKAFNSNGNLGLKIGFDKVDIALGGMQSTDMMVIGARPGVGKTAFAVSIIRNILMQNKKVGFFSMEMSCDQIMIRLMSMITSIDSTRMRDARIDEQEWTRITAYSSTISEKDLFIYDKPIIKASEIMMQARAWKIEHGLDLIIVDYLTKIKHDKDLANQNLSVGETITTMKNMAKLLNVPVIVLAQLNRDNMKRSNKKPMMSDLRDSGIIEQEADQIILLHRPSTQEQEEEQKPKEVSNFASKYVNKTQEQPKVQDMSDYIIVDKNRHGQKIEVKADFIKHLAMWTEWK